MQHGGCIIRALCESDSPAIARLLVNLALETPYVLMSPAETREAARHQPARTAAVVAAPNQQIFVAEQGAELAGFIALSQGLFEKNAHVASLMIGVLRAHWGCRVAQDLMDAALGWARDREIRRIELGVMEGNTRALRFYLRYGFVREGVRSAAFVIDGEPVDELFLARTRMEEQ